MFSLIPFAAREFLGKWWPVILAIVVIGGLTLAIYLRGVSAGKSVEIVKQVTRENEVQLKINAANEKAAEARVEASLEIQKQAEELKDAEQDVETLDSLRIKRGCVIMRQQGRDVSKIPACH